MTVKTPFYIGQAADDVLKVAKRTNRKRLAVEFTTEDGETFRFDLDAGTARERRARREAMEAEVNGKRIDMARLPRVLYFYPDCVLTFEKTRGPSGSGALCYRIVSIGRYCEACERTIPLDEWTMDEYRCDACVWDALETESYGEALAYMGEETEGDDVDFRTD